MINAQIVPATAEHIAEIIPACAWPTSKSLPPRMAGVLPVFWNVVFAPQPSVVPA